ncbi:MAG TPA: tetratricopeptide repeat protein [Tepidisphaeraceae bacterium]|jgi:predicted O-linked N-acetylglucosamine transferase (SPINDLY family)
MNPLLQQAISLHQHGQLDQAEALYRQVLATEPANPDAHHFLGVLLDNSGRHDQGIAHIRRAIQIHPASAAYYNNLGEALRKTNQLDDAMDAMQQSLALRPDNALTWYNIGLIHSLRQQFAESAEAYRKATALRPDFAIAWNNLGLALAHLERVDEAASAFEKAVALDPALDYPYMNLAMARSRAERDDEAIALCQKGLSLNPKNPSGYYNLALILVKRARLAEALAAYLRAIELAPGHALAHNNAGNIYRDLGMPDDAIREIRRSLGLESNHLLHVNLLHALYSSALVDPMEVRREHEKWAEDATRSITPFARWSSGQSNRLRVGYVSPDFREHSVAYFLEPILANHDRARFEIYCYSDVKQPDATTERLKTYAHTWRDVIDQSDEELADVIHHDGIDLLIDLAGHTTGNRLLTFARKPAPTQASYIGYPNTTGLKAIDYRITDALADPIDAQWTEKVIRVPGCFLCYRIPTSLPDVSPLPAQSAGHITFGCFNAVSKLNDTVLSLWSRLLAEMPTARLMLKGLIFIDPVTKAFWQDRLKRAAIDPARVDLITRTKTQSEHLALYNKVDIALDPFPYNGTTTTCEALAMGVPVLSLQGNSHISRVGVSLLTTVGLSDWVAEDQDQYVHKARKRASDLESLSRLRQQLRNQLKLSPLCDEPPFARTIESAYIEMTRQLTAPPAPLPENGASA